MAQTPMLFNTKSALFEDCLVPWRPKTLSKEGRTTNNYIANVKDQDDFFDAIDKEWNGALPFTLIIAPGGKVLHKIADEIDPMDIRKKLVDYLGNTYK